MADRTGEPVYYNEVEALLGIDVITLSRAEAESIYLSYKQIESGIKN